MDKWDSYSILIYIIISLIIFVIPDSSQKKDILLGYSFLTTLFLYLFNYKSLRKLNVWLIWICISLSHIYLYNQLIANDSYNYSIRYLRFSFFFLLLFQLLRFVSLIFQKVELVAPNRGSADIWDKRELTFTDYFCFITYFTTFIFFDKFIGIASL